MFSLYSKTYVDYHEYCVIKKSIKFKSPNIVTVLRCLNWCADKHLNIIHRDIQHFKNKVWNFIVSKFSPIHNIFV